MTSSKTRVQPFDINVRATALHFVDDTHLKARSRYIVLAERLDYLEFQSRYHWSGWPEVKQCTPVNIGGNSDRERFFVVYCADCFDPPMAVVQAENESDAEEWFVSELPWSHYSPVESYFTEAELNKALDDGTAGIGPSGEVYDSQAVQMFEVFLVHVELAP